MSEAEGVSKSFDPRFNPAFQPGYVPREHREEPQARAPRNDSLPDRGGLIPEPRRVADAASDVSASHDDLANVHTTAVATSTTATATGVDDEPVAWWQRVNPWFLVLWVLGIVFIGAAVGLIAWAMSGRMNSYQGEEDGQIFFFLLQTAWTVSPMLMMLGLATITSTLVIQAAQWKRRDRA